MPTPASPTTATTWPCPAPACARAWCRAASSVCRPTKRVSPRAAAPAGACGPGRRPTSSNTSTGSGSPLTGTGPRAVTWTNPSASRRVVGGQPNAPGGRQLLHAGRQVRGLAHGRVVHVQVVADGPHHHLPGVEPDADLHLDAMRAAHLLGCSGASPPAWPGRHSRPARHGPHGPSARQTAP